MLHYFTIYFNLIKKRKYCCLYYEYFYLHSTFEKSKYTIIMKLFRKRWRNSEGVEIQLEIPQ